MSALALRRTRSAPALAAAVFPVPRSASIGGYEPPRLFLPSVTASADEVAFDGVLVLQYADDVVLLSASMVGLGARLDALQRCSAEAAEATMRSRARFAYASFDLLP